MYSEYKMPELANQKKWNWDKYELSIACYTQGFEVQLQELKADENSPEMGLDEDLQSFEFPLSIRGLAETYIKIKSIFRELEMPNPGKITWGEIYQFWYGVDAVSGTATAYWERDKEPTKEDLKSNPSNSLTPLLEEVLSFPL